MSLITESTVLAFVSAHARPFVTLTSVRQHFGESAFGIVKFHIGALTRKCYLKRANYQQDVAYWTDATAKEVQALMTKPVVKTPIPETVIASSPYAKKPAPVPVPETRSREVKITFEPVVEPPPKPVVNPPEIIDGVRVARFALEKRPQKVYMGNLRRVGLNGIVAMAMYLHKGRAFTPQAVSQMCPDLTIDDIRRILNVLSKGDPQISTRLSYLKRSITSPFVYRWSELYEYPFPNRAESDGTGVVELDIAGWTSLPPTAFYDDDPERAEEYNKILNTFQAVTTRPTPAPHQVFVDVKPMPLKALLEESAQATVWPPASGIAVTPAEVPAVEEKAVEEKAADEKIVDEKIVDKPLFRYGNLSDLAATPKPVDETLKGEVGEVVQLSVLEITAGDTSRDRVHGADDKAMATKTPEPEIEQTFGANLNLAGELTLHVRGKPIKLTKYETRCLIALVGPHYEPDHHRVIPKTKPLMR